MDAERIIQRLAAAGPRRPLAHPMVTAVRWVLAVSAYAAVVAANSDLRADLAVKSRQAVFLMELVGMLVTCGTAAVAASWLALPDVGQKAWVRYLPFLPLLLLGALLGEQSAATNAGPLLQVLDRDRIDCVIRIVVFSLPPTAWLFWSIGRSAPTRCCWAGCMASLSVASLGYVLSRLTDPSDDPNQLIVWHYLPVLLVTMIGMAVGRVYFARSAWRS